jgi:DNA-binding HxlR family transcriptional regulator
MSYHEILESCGEMQRKCLYAFSVLGSPKTANELAKKMANSGAIPYFDRNFVHPRLNELVEKGLVEVKGKRKCTVTGKTCAEYYLSDEGMKVILQLL